MLVLLPLLLTGVQPCSAELVLYWALDEGQGTFISDSSGKGNHGTLSGTSTGTWTQGRRGAALYFDGSTPTQVGVPSNGTLQITNAITIAAWARNDDPGRDGPILARESGGGGLSYCFGCEAGGFGMLLDGNGSYSWDLFDRDNGNVLNGRWTHLASTWDGTTVRFYQDGVVLPQTPAFTGPLFPGSSLLALGVNSEWVSTKFKGVLDEVRLYNHALSPVEIGELAAVKPDTTTALALSAAILWNSVTGMLYQVQWASKLDTNTWFNLGDPVLGNGTTNVVSDLTQASQRFYRVVPLP
jgi:hypothetical protein